MKEMRFSKIRGKLLFDWGLYRAVSGPHGKGSMPTGEYDVAVRRVVDKGLGSPYTAGGASFFIPLEAKFETNRNGFGIHPDGNVRGTIGCIGIVAYDALRFWEHWMRTAIEQRPTRLVVED